MSLDPFECVLTLEDASSAPQVIAGVLWGFALGVEETLVEASTPMSALAGEIASGVAALRVAADEVRVTVGEIRTSRSNVLGQLPALVGVEEAAMLLGIDVEALRSRLKRGQIPEAAIRRTGKARGGKRGGNSGRVQFWRDVLVGLVNVKGSKR